MTRHLLHIILIHLTINLFGQQGSSSYQFMLCDSGKTIECNSSSDFHIYTVHTYSKRTLNTESECRNWSYDNTKKAWDIFINWMNIPMAEIYIIKNKKDTMSILILISQEKLLLDLNSISYTKGKYSITTIPRTDIDNEMEKIVTDNKNYWKRQNELYANLQNQIKDNLEKNKPQPLPQTQQ